MGVYKEAIPCGRLRGKSEYGMFYKIRSEHGVHSRSKERERGRRERIRLREMRGGQQNPVKVSGLHPRAVGKL